MSGKILNIHWLQVFCFRHYDLWIYKAFLTKFYHFIFANRLHHWNTVPACDLQNWFLNWAHFFTVILEHTSDRLGQNLLFHILWISFYHSKSLKLLMSNPANLRDALRIRHSTIMSWSFLYHVGFYFFLNLWVQMQLLRLMSCQFSSILRPCSKKLFKTYKKFLIQ